MFALSYSDSAYFGFPYDARLCGFCGSYQTSAIIHQYGNSQYVAATLGLFSAIALMFWYILQILMSSRR
ncbi:MAG: hypothetical protein ACLUKN_04700 [Bacilli bacterium]